jgi:DNA-binding protein H-NS
MPQWLVQVTSAGQALEHFAIRKPEERAEAPRPRVDWANDPFAGSRLATVSAERL